MDKHLRLVKKTFNVISVAMINQLLTIFKNDPSLKLFKEQIQEFAETKEDFTPALHYFQTMNIETLLEGKYGKMAVGEMVLNKDARLFTGEVGVRVPALDALQLSQKWPKLSEKNQDYMWDYLIRMANHSVEIAMLMRLEENPSLVSQFASLPKLNPRATAEEYRAYTNELMRILSQ